MAQDCASAVLNVEGDSAQRFEIFKARFPGFCFQLLFRVNSKRIKKQKPSQIWEGFNNFESFVARLGLEPRLTVPKTAVLPLDDRAICRSGAKIIPFFLPPK